MKAELRAVVVADLSGQPEEVYAFALGSELLTGLYFDEGLAGLIGFIPQGEDAYLWMVKTPLAAAHPLVFARYAKRTIECLKTKYRQIRGHSDVASARWLQFIGADVNVPTNNIVEFTIHGR